MFPVWPDVKNLAEFRCYLRCCCRYCWSPCVSLTCNGVDILLCLMPILVVVVLAVVVVIHHFSLRRQFRLIYDYFQRRARVKKVPAYVHTCICDIFIYIYLHMILYAPRKSFFTDEQAIHVSAHMHIRWDAIHSLHVNFVWKGELKTLSAPHPATFFSWYTILNCYTHKSRWLTLPFSFSLFHSLARLVSFGISISISIFPFCPLLQYRSLSVSHTSHSFLDPGGIFSCMKKHTNVSLTEKKPKDICVWDVSMYEWNRSASHFLKQCTVRSQHLLMSVFFSLSSFCDIQKREKISENRIHSQ